MSDKKYLGDGLYFHYDGYQVWLTSEDGVRVINEVALEPAVLNNFLSACGELFNFSVVHFMKDRVEHPQEMAREYD